MNLVGTSAGALVTWGMGSLRDRGISLGVAFTISAAFAGAGALVILLARPREEKASLPEDPPLVSV
jgi:hypothetical protein